MPIIVIVTAQEGTLKHFSKIWEHPKKITPVIKSRLPVSHVYFLQLKVMEWKI